MRCCVLLLLMGVLVTSPLTFAATTTTKPMPRQEWGAPLVEVHHDDDSGDWRIEGKTQRVRIDGHDYGMTIRSGPSASWRVVPPAPDALIVKRDGKEFPLRVGDAQQIDAEPYDTGFKTGIKVTLSGWVDAPDLKLVLTIAVEGKDEDLVLDAAAVEAETVVRRLDFPAPIDGSQVDCTLLSNYRGILLPRDWPKPFFPIRATNPDGSAKTSDTSAIQSNVIESWSMSWWGFEQGPAAMMVIVETPNDAAYQFEHPAGGPTTIGPRWRTSLGALRYPRSCRMCFFAQGNYVDLAKRYRRYAIEHGLFVPLTEKIARKPIVKELIGTPLVRAGILTNIQHDSLRYSTTNPAHNFHLISFDDRAKQFRQWKEKGLDHLHVCLTGWPNQGYDRQHPDELPPAPWAGGWDGMKRLVDTCHEIGYLISLHDQYRDYYTDAQSFDTQFAIHEEDDRTPSPAFPGSRFGQTKEGVIPYMNNWDGGKMTYLNNRLMPGHLKKNYKALFDHGIRPDGIYLDVFGYVPPDEDFNPEHPTSRADAIAARAECYTWSRANIGFIGTEAGCDWTVPYADVSSPLKSNKAIAVPLFNLVYHDAIITPYSPNDLYGFLNAGLPQMFNPEEVTPADLKTIGRMAALQKRLATAEMTRHEFLSPDFKRERTTFSDGTRVTVDWTTSKVDIAPEVSDQHP